MNTTLAAAIVAAPISGLGWAAAQIFALNREGVTRELSIRLKVLERQIEEFYGPLFSLTNQIQDARAVRTNLARACVAAFKRGLQWDEPTMSWLSSEEDRKTWPISDEEIRAVSEDDLARYRNTLPVSTLRFYTLEQFVFPLYDQTTKVLSEKLHLLDSPDIPESYRAFMRHALQNRIQNRLFIDKKVPTNLTDWPDGRAALGRVKELTNSRSLTPRVRAVSAWFLAFGQNRF